MSPGPMLCAAEPLCAWYGVPMPTRFVALLRGINVGRNKQVAMADLRALLAALGYGDVQTYLRSGNVLFTSDAEPADIAAAIEQALLRDLKLQSRVVVRTAADLAAVIAANPLRELATDPSKYLAGFLDGDPDPAAAEKVAALNVAPDRVILLGRELYLWCPAGLLASPLSKVAWERLLGVAVTMRNWNTVTQLAALVGA